MRETQSEAFGGEVLACRVTLIANTTDPVRVVAASAKLCYSSSPAGELFDGLDEAGVLKFLDRLRSSGHMSVFEHASFTFAIDGLSRVASHQLVRHRVASFSQQSQRYVAMDYPRVVIPPEIEKNPAAKALFREQARAAHEAYKKMTELGVPREDARFILPHGCETSLVMTMNARELHHFFSLRLCRRAQWEIRELARVILIAVRREAAPLFASAGPPCVTGACGEENPCGRPYSGTEEIISGE